MGLRDWNYFWETGVATLITITSAIGLKAGKIIKIQQTLAMVPT